MRLTRTFNAGHDNLYLNKDDVNRLLKGQMLKESSLIVQMENPEREWVGLTDEDCDEVERWVEFKEEGSGRIPTPKLIQYIQAKLKERNT